MINSLVRDKEKWKLADIIFNQKSIEDDILWMKAA